MILVFGATGKVGRQVVAELLDAGAPVRAMVRNPSSADLPAGVEVVPGDLSSPDSVAAALPGVTAAFLVWPFPTADGAPAVVDAIAQQASRIVYLSAMGVQDDVEQQAEPITAFHAELERLIQRSGRSWTFLRSGGFASNTLAWAGQVRGEGVVRAPFADATRSLVHERDIAAVAAKALTEDGHAGAKYQLTGPEALTQAEQAAIIGEVIGRPVRFAEQTRAEARADMLAKGWPDMLVDGVLAAWSGLVANPEPVLPTVESVTGVPGRTYRQWVADNAAAFS